MNGPTGAAARLPLVTVVVPAFNEALKLESSLIQIYAYLQGLSDRYRFELLVVDDGSTDDTGAIASAFAATHAGVRLLRHAVNFRLGQALQYAFRQSLGDYVVVFDSDLSYSVDHIGWMLAAMEREHARIVVASPYMRGGTTKAIPWSREAMSKGVNRLLAATYQGNVHTVTGMVRCYDGLFIRSLDLKSLGPEINTEILYKAQIMRARIVEIPAHLDWSDQTERMATRKVSIRVSTTSKLLMFASFLFRPIFFFLIPGTILLIIAIWTLSGVAWVIVQQFPEVTGSLDSRLMGSFQRAYELRPHSFVVGGFSLVIAVQLISLGVLATQGKRYFEETYHLGVMLTRRVERLEQAQLPIQPAPVVIPPQATGPTAPGLPVPVAASDAPAGPVAEIPGAVELAPPSGGLPAPLHRSLTDDTWAPPSGYAGRSPL